MLNLQNVVKSYVLHYMTIGYDEFDVFGAVDAHLVPEHKQSLLVVMH